jgi:thioredoxin-related protein
MKSLITLLITTAFIVNIDAQKIECFQGSWNDANTAAIKENKYIFLKAYTDWCHWCKVMDKELLTDPEVANFINENFIPVKMNFEEEMGVKLAQKFRVGGFPTVLYFNPEGQLANKVSGYNPDARAFIEESKSFMSEENQNRYGFDSRQLKVKFPDFYLKSFGKSDEKEFPEQEEVDEFLNNQSDLFSEVSWSVMWRFGLSEKHSDFFVQNYSRYKKLYGDEVKNRLYRVVNQRVLAAADKGDEEMFKNAMSIVEEHSEDKEGAMFSFSLVYYEKTADWQKYARHIQKHVTQNGYEEGGRINSWGWTIYEDCKDEEVVATAANWMKEVCAISPDYYYLDTYAALLYKDKKYKEAQTQAKLAIEVGVKHDEDVAVTKELLERINKELE